MSGTRRALKFAWAVFKELWHRRDEGWTTMVFQLHARTNGRGTTSLGAITVEG